jgi:hypothetical protein
MALALILAVRLLSPAGFMPAFDRGAVTIVACPDAEPVPASMGAHNHHDGHSKSFHQSCPYAAASALGALGAEFAPPIGPPVIGLAVVVGRTFTFIAPRRANDRPPPTGPPIPR